MGFMISAETVACLPPKSILTGWGRVLRGKGGEYTPWKVKSFLCRKIICYFRKTMLGGCPAVRTPLCLLSTALGEGVAGEGSLMLFFGIHKENLA